jgi:hypothetical protein
MLQMNDPAVSPMQRRKLSSNTPTLRQAVVLPEPERGEPYRPFIDSHFLRSHQSFPIHSRRLATLVAQPVTITLPLGSKI